RIRAHPPPKQSPGSATNYGLRDRRCFSRLQGAANSKRENGPVLAISAAPQGSPVLATVMGSAQALQPRCGPCRSHAGSENEPAIRLTELSRRAITLAISESKGAGGRDTGSSPGQ